MIKHVVLFKINENFADNKEFAANEIVKTLEVLPSKIDLIKGYELGINFAKKETAYDVCLISSFESQEDLDNYRTHPEHVAAVEKIKFYISKTAFADYDTE